MKRGNPVKKSILLSILLSLICLFFRSQADSGGTHPLFQDPTWSAYHELGDKDLLEYPRWPSLTEKPFAVSEGVWSACVPPLGPSQEADKHGPHFVPKIKVYANPLAHSFLKKGSRVARIPVGSIVVKEKWGHEKSGGPSAYAAMVKKEKGYDPKNGDWEYVFVDLKRGEGKEITRGRIVSCIQCHRSAASQDHLFKTYLDFK